MFSPITDGIGDAILAALLFLGLFLLFMWVSRKICGAFGGRDQAPEIGQASDHGRGNSASDASGRGHGPVVGASAMAATGAHGERATAASGSGAPLADLPKSEATSGHHGGVSADGGATIGPDGGSGMGANDNGNDGAGVGSVSGAATAHEDDAPGAASATVNHAATSADRAHATTPNGAANRSAQAKADDVDGDGVADILDVDGDGAADVDLSGGAVDISTDAAGTAVDLDGDGVADGTTVDRDGDGVADGVDLDGDGVVDVAARIGEGGRLEGSKPAAEMNDAERAAAAASAGLLDAPRGGVADDLKKIKGVGPKFETLLNNLGVFHFDQIANWKPIDIQFVDDQLTAFKGRILRDDWVGQAKILAAGGATVFSQKVDKGGVY